MSVKKAGRDRDVARIAERQMRNWELARGQRVAAAEVRGAKVAEFITISREVGAGGSEVAAAVGTRLGWPVFDKEILHFMAGDDAIRERIYRSMDERDLSWCEEALRSLTEPEFVRNDYFHRLCETVLTLARQGSAVFLGRGADLILPREIGVRVRIVAPMAKRMERVMKREALSAEAARAMIERSESERAAFLMNHFDVDMGGALRHDVVLSLDRMSVEQGVELVLSARKLLNPAVR